MNNGFLQRMASAEIREACGS